MDKVSVAWAAGIFEGEGCINIRKRDNRTEVSLAVKMTDEDVLIKLRSALNLSGVTGPYYAIGLNRKPHWTWTVSSYEDVQAVLAMFWGHLCKRRKERAKLALAALKTQPGRARRGEEHHAAKLTIDSVRAIKQSLDSDVVLAKRYGVLRQAISKIRNGQRWKHA